MKFWIAYEFHTGWRLYTKEPTSFEEKGNRCWGHRCLWLHSPIQHIFPDLGFDPRILHEYERDKDGTIRHVTDWEPA